MQFVSCDVRSIGICAYKYIYCAYKFLANVSMVLINAWDGKCSKICKHCTHKLVAVITATALHELHVWLRRNIRNTRCLGSSCVYVMWICSGTFGPIFVRVAHRRFALSFLDMIILPSASLWLTSLSTSPYRSVP